MQIASDLLRLYLPPILSAGNKKRRHSAEANVIQRGHELLNVPQYAGQYKGRGPNTIEGFGKCAKQYQQQRCQGARCSAMTRTYCACNPRAPLCQACFALHFRHDVWGHQAASFPRVFTRRGITVDIYHIYIISDARHSVTHVSLQQKYDEHAARPADMYSRSMPLPPRCRPRSGRLVTITTLKGRATSDFHS